MDLGTKLAIAVAVVGAGFASWLVISGAARRASHRRRQAAAHGLGDDAHRHSYASRRADDQLRDGRGDYPTRLAREIAKEAGWYALPDSQEDDGPLPLPLQNPWRRP